MKKVLYVLLALIILIVTGYQLLKFKSKPKYDGEMTLSGLSSEAEVYFDDFGVPHIYAANAEDAYRAMGYVHAQDRLFQMEMMRRVGTGTLAELLGEDLLDVDKFFRTLGIPKHAAWSTEVWDKAGPSEWKSATEAYIMGVNAFIENGNLPIEYTLLRHKPQPFTINDIHAITGYMSFTFAMAMRTDPIVTKMARQLGPKYLDALSVHTLPEHYQIPNNYPQRDSLNRIQLKGNSLLAMLDRLPVPLLEGSNAWVISGKRTKSGQVLFCNDTHIGFAQPSVWYEAHIEYPGFSYYGNHLAGMPFGLVGHTRHHSIGLTMFENDDQDFFEEKLDPKNATQTIYGDGFKPISIRKEIINVKGKDPIEFEIRESIHGPIVNEVIPEIGRLTTNPVASWWVYVLEPTRALEATWKMARASNIQEFEDGVRLIHAPGLNVMYGDNGGNIAWWATAKLPIRPTHVNSKIFMDGSNPDDEPLGWFPFEENPMSINPESGFVASANNQPDTLSNGTFFPGYYYPGDRWNRIAKTVTSRTDWTQESIKSLQIEAINENHPINAKSMIQQVDPSVYAGFETVVETLENWDGSHGLESTAPTLYYKWLYHTLHSMMVDELGEDDFANFVRTFLYVRSVPKLIRSQDSPWWDNVQTDAAESSKQIIEGALKKSLTELSTLLGSDPSAWEWQKVVVLEHPHPLGAKKPLDKIFNVKAPPVTANEESVNKLAFTITSDGNYKVTSGPAMRIIMDFADVEAAESVLPTGQSGNVFSPWYQDQAVMYATGKYRPMLMNVAAIKSSKKKLILSP